MKRDKKENTEETDRKKNVGRKQAKFKRIWTKLAWSKKNNVLKKHFLKNVS